jgi:hypothetical protein
VRLPEIITVHEQYEIVVALTVLAWAAEVFQHSLIEEVDHIKKIG